ncbi:hypothetical protein ALP05_02445 [Pseudomonas caricapapayae]|uniref:Peptidase M50 n=1 Tax=Pseudomonas caricapapayae TaxID=46678 RepID=A0A3M6F825_9PSED|nr:HlyD family efflux transporter periplasmic adaptor subunit [Pseudomonas caricapapayae]RMV76785.1 hypothetical protein ALP05_02445 [Pseudomonas caricapapayae]
MAVSISANPPVAAPAALAPLRPGLRLHPGPRLHDGSPSWTLEDPVRGSYFRLGWEQAEIFNRWALAEPQAIAQAISSSTTLALGIEDVEAFARFLEHAQLLQVTGASGLRNLRQRHAGQRRHWAAWLLGNYLSLRVPLLRPDRFLRHTLPYVRPLLGARFALASALAGLLGLYLVAQQWDSFIHTFLHFFSLQGAALAALTLTLSKTLHEFGHAYACKHQGCRVPTMGVALLVLWPVLYTDASGGWRLPLKRQRLAIGAAGMLAELYLAAWALLAWSFLNDGPLRSAAFMLASTTWLMTLAVNLNPLMRFDGYFLFSDLLEVPNLQQRAFELARWQLRRWLFGLGDSAPEHFPPRLRRVLLSYAFGTWVYRFFLFLGIALLVYHFAFKLLGLFLFAVEIVHFIGRPIFTELHQWYGRRKDYRMNRNTLFSASLLGVGLLLALLPWQTDVSAPALWRAQRQANLYVPVGAQLAALPVEAGKHVSAGGILFSLDAPALIHDLDQLDRTLGLLRQQASLQRRGREGSAQQNVAQEQLQAALSQRQALAGQIAQLQVRAQFDGVLSEREPSLGEGQWLAAGQWLGTFVAPGQALVEAFVNERDRVRLAEGAPAWFYPSDPQLPRRRLQVMSIAQTAVHSLQNAPELASVYQGALAAQWDAQHQPIPEQALYRVVLSTEPGATAQQVLAGRVSIEAEARSPLIQGLREGLAVVIRESAF